MLNKLTKFIPNKIFNIINLFFFKYRLCIKRKLNLTVVNKRLLHHPISQQTELINMINAENLSYPCTEQVVNKINYLHIEKNTYLICNTNLTLTNTYAQTI